MAQRGRLGARLVLRRAVEEEVTAFPGRSRYERSAEASGSRNGTRPKAVRTAEGELSIDMPQICGSAERPLVGVSGQSDGHSHTPVGRR